MTVTRELETTVCFEIFAQVIRLWTGGSISRGAGEGGGGWGVQLTVRLYSARELQCFSSWMYLYSRDFTCWKCERAYPQLDSSHSSWQHVSWWKAYVVTVGCVSSVFDHIFTSVLFFVNRKFTVLCDAFPSCLAICEDVKELSEKNHSTIAFYFGLKFRVVRGRVTATVDVFVERFRLKELSLTSRIDHYASSPYNF